MPGHNVMELGIWEEQRSKEAGGTIVKQQHAEWRRVVVYAGRGRGGTGPTAWGHRFAIPAHLPAGVWS